MMILLQGKDHLISSNGVNEPRAEQNAARAVSLNPRPILPEAKVDLSVAYTDSGGGGAASESSEPSEPPQ
ncbi:hypothetical protein F8M41_002546 [Gigaspora margarita]|uniref:Uncharacterized protein n=1 Tax=Gigaspora margarita TaxID=4874 RepID=A0A8H3XE48_GIGMA|nr:hypothetical protein F8M41_002546 [Gigaspora margarita]